MVIISLATMLFVFSLVKCGPAPSDNAYTQRSGEGANDFSEAHLKAEMPRQEPAPAKSLPQSAKEPSQSSKPLSRTIPERIAQNLTSSNVHIRLDALDEWQHDRHIGYDPLMVALTDPDEKVRDRALQLIQEDWAAEQSSRQGHVATGEDQRPR